MKVKARSKYPHVIEPIARYTGNSSADLISGWYLCDDGNVWYVNYTLISNEGTPADFIKTANDKRLVWLPGYPERLDR
jgi:hypothetical protein